MAIGVTPYRRFSQGTDGTGISGINIATTLLGSSEGSVDIEDQDTFIRFRSANFVSGINGDIPHSGYEIVGVECQVNQEVTNPAGPLNGVTVKIFNNDNGDVYHNEVITAAGLIGSNLKTFGGPNNINPPILHTNQVVSQVTDNFDFELKITDDAPSLTWTINGNNTDPSPAMRVYYRYGNGLQVTAGSKLHITTNSKLSLT